AGRARREGHARQAARLYRELSARHGASPEALASRLSLARLLLTRLHDPRGALRELDAYLRQAPHGPVAPECRYQRTLALRRLGRTEEEQRALRRSLREDPRSVYATAVRRRLDELNGGGAGE
ncbi:MAG: tetratricopeptide repeat protein, partial [Deltaproteobacteria bacterium]|nr:tetratricopeptide repeat protein [Deltaproteobacteria bacterium]